MSGTSSGGGGGGMDWVALGSQIHEDSLEAMTFFSDFMNEEWAKRQKNKEFSEDKRRFDINSSQTNRAQNLSALNLLSRKRNIKPMSYTDAVSKAVRSY